MKPTLFIGADHAGYALKQRLLEILAPTYDVIDCSSASLDPHDDYPDCAAAVCEKVLTHTARGILICDTGIGMSIAANRYSGIRAALVTTEFMAERSRLHNDANVLCLGAALVDMASNEGLVQRWLRTDFSAVERHIRRIQKLDMLG